MSDNTPELGSALSRGPESSAGVVVQPSKVEYAAFLEGISKMSEQTGEDHSGDWSAAASGGQVAQTGGSAQGGTSARDLAIANLPSEVVMQKQLEQHIRT